MLLHNADTQKLATIESRLMHLPSVGTPVRPAKLKTMTSCKKKRVTTKDSKRHRVMVLALKTQLLIDQQQKSAADAAGQKYCLLSQALVDAQGLPRKPAEANMRKVLQGRYSNAFSHSVPQGFASDKTTKLLYWMACSLFKHLPSASTQPMPIRPCFILSSSTSLSQHTAYAD